MAFEDKLRSALEDAVKFCNDGSTPDEAVCKAASAHEFNSDQTDRLVETLNTAITINQYKQASDRTASFPLAHKDKVASMMLDADKVLGKSEKAAEVNHIYFDYSKPAYDYVAHEDDVIEKVAENEEKTTGLSRDNLAYLLVNQMKLVKNAADFAANIAGMMKSDLITQLYGLAETIKKGGVEKYARFKESANKDIVKELDKVLPVQFKEAKCKSSLVDDSDLSVEIKTAEDMAETMSSMKDMRDQADSMHKQAEKMSSEITLAFTGEPTEEESFLGLFKKADARDDKIDDLTQKLRDLTQINKENNESYKKKIKEYEKRLKDEKPNALYYTAFGKDPIADLEGIGVKPISQLDSLFFKDQSKENDERKRTAENLRRSLMLQHLMITDPIISEADPDVVASTYQALVQTSPHVANNEEVVRAVLRQAVNSVAISPFDAATWADLEKKQREAARIV